MPPTPPPDVDVDAWARTIDEMERRAPERLALIHFGVATDVTRHLEALRARLREWADAVAGGVTQEEFEALALRGGDVPDADAYDRAMPLWQSYQGLVRWAEKQREAVA